MNHSIDLTIAIPTYKRPKDIEQCLRSIVGQPIFSDTAVEILISDNAPEDSAEKSVAPFLLQHPNQIRYIKNPKNIGAENNIFQLIREAKGRFVFFISDDDQMNPSSLPVLLQTLKENMDVGAFITNMTISCQQKITRRVDLFSSTQDISKDDPGKIAKLFASGHTLSGLAVRKDLVDLDKCQKYEKMLYPQMYIITTAALQQSAFYLYFPVINHTIGNEVSWTYNENYYYSYILEIWRDTFHNFPDHAEEALRKLLNDTAYIYYINLLHPRWMLSFTGFLAKERLFSQPKRCLFIIEGIWLLITSKILQVLRQLTKVDISS
jgi:glycosyltransferase involved in cell wall biosynthesis